MNRGRTLTLRANFSWVLAGNLAYALSQGVLLVAFARVLTPVALGAYALALAVTAPVLLLAGMGLRVLMATDQQARYQLGDYVATRAIALVVGSAVIAGFILIASIGNPYVVLLVLAGKIVESFGDLLFGVFGNAQKMDPIGKSRFFQAALKVTVVVSTLVLSRSIWIPLVAIVFVNAAVLVAYQIPTALKVLPSTALLHSDRPYVFRFAATRSLIGGAWPLGIVAALVSLQSAIPRVEISRLLGEAQLGFFVAVAYVSVLGTLFNNALGETVAPRLALWYDEGAWRRINVLLLRLIGGILGLGLLGMGVVALRGAEALELIYGSEYANRDLLIWVVATVIVAAITSLLGYALTATRSIRVQIPITLVSVGVTLALCETLIPSAGIIGAAQAVFWAMVTRGLLDGLALARKGFRPVALG